LLTEQICQDLVPPAPIYLLHIGCWSDAPRLQSAKVIS